MKRKRKKKKVEEGKEMKEVQVSQLYDDRDKKTYMERPNPSKMNSM